MFLPYIGMVAPVATGAWVKTAAGVGSPIESPFEQLRGCQV
jgi:hypothetical protein